MYKKVIVIIAVIFMLTGVAFAASDNDDKEISPTQSGWVQGSRPVTETDPVIGGTTMVGTYWRTRGDVGSSPGTHFLGTTDNQALFIKVNNQLVYAFYPHSTSPNIVGGYSGNFVLPGEYGSTISGGGSYGAVNSVLADYCAIGGGKGNSASANYSVVGGGRSNAAGGYYSVASGGYSNASSGYASGIAGGYNNEATGRYSFVCGGYYNSASDDYVTVSGGRSNTASGMYSTVAGGTNNQALGDRATVSGGYACIAGDNQAVVGGGQWNQAYGLCSVIAGGFQNEATDDYSVVCGGSDNDAFGEYSFIGGGNANRASGYASAIIGGIINYASERYAIASGFRAKAIHQGTFVWGDNSAADVSSTANNQFIARATGGVYFYTNAALTTGAYLASGSGSWSSVSDKNVKENFSAVDGAEILARVADLEITNWNYKSQDEKIRHIGPMAQDFHAAFGVGDDDKHLTTVDVDGIALASIQALYAENQELKTQLQDQQKYLESLEARLETLEAGR